MSPVELFLPVKSASGAPLLLQPPPPHFEMTWVSS